MDRPEFEVTQLCSRIGDIEHLEQIGTRSFFHGSNAIMKLTAQALIEARERSSEKLVLDEICAHSSLINMLLRRTIAVDLWLSRVRSALKHKVGPMGALKAQHVSLHMCHLLDLLSKVLPYSDAMQQADPALLVSLVDVCHSRILTVLRDGASNDASVSQMHKQLLHKRETELARQKDVTKYIQMTLSANEASGVRDGEYIFACAAFSLSLLRVFVARATGPRSDGDLHVSVVRRIAERDFSSPIAELIDQTAFTVHLPEGDVLQYQGSTEWHPVSAENAPLLTQFTGQCWYLLHQLILSREFASRTKLTESKARRIGSTIRDSLSKEVMQQMPMLENLSRFESHLRIVSYDPNSLESLHLRAQGDTKAERARHASYSAVLIEEVSEYRETLLREAGDLDEFVRQLLSERGEFSENLRERQQDMAVITDAYDSFGTELHEQVRKANCCAQCNVVAKNRCSRCKQVWYCSRTCQRNHWTLHKQDCRSFSLNAVAASKGDNTTSTGSCGSSAKILEIDGSLNPFRIIDDKQPRNSTARDTQGEEKSSILIQELD
ncbi:MAG: hypothetical protein MHM6MM_002407 [Cercozoa sp. M6MM]